MLEFVDTNILVVTVATQETSAFRHFRRSVLANGLPLKVLGMGMKWEGLGQKVSLLREELEHHKEDLDKIILFTDGNDVLFNAGAGQIIRRFVQFNAKILFSAEEFSWPEPSLAKRYLTIYYTGL